jgi:hypothetical protein
VAAPVMAYAAPLAGRDAGLPGDHVGVPVGAGRLLGRPGRGEQDGRPGVEVHGLLGGGRAPLVGRGRAGGGGDRAVGDPQRLGDLVVAKAGEGDQEEHVALPPRERRDRPGELGAQALSADTLVDLVGALVAADHLGRDPVQPGAHARAVRVVAPPLPERLQERLCRHVRGGIRAEPLGGVPVDLREVGVEDVAEAPGGVGLLHRAGLLHRVRRRGIPRHGKPFRGADGGHMGITRSPRSLSIVPPRLGRRDEGAARKGVGRRREGPVRWVHDDCDDGVARARAANHRRPAGTAGHPR